MVHTAKKEIVVEINYSFLIKLQIQKAISAILDPLNLALLSTFCMGKYNCFPTMRPYIFLVQFQNMQVRISKSNALLKVLHVASSG